MITSFKLFEELDISGINSENEVKKRELLSDLNDYNSKKSQLKSITGQPNEKWEEAAKKIILNNSFLATEWRLIKNRFDLDLLKKSSIPSDSKEASKRLENIKTIENDIRNIETDFNKKLQEQKKILQ